MWKMCIFAENKKLKTYETSYTFCLLVGCRNDDIGL
jgi:hypothetical protein